MKCYIKTISELRMMFKNKQIKLGTPYRKQAAWKAKHRRLLLSSIFNGIPISGLIFYKSPSSCKEKNVYDILDGRQRLETILHFIGEIKFKDKNELWVEFKNPKSGKKDYLYFDELRLKRVNKEYLNILEKFWQYPIPIIECENDLTDIFDRKLEIFLTINSTGLRLTMTEKRNIYRRQG